MTAKRLAFQRTHQNDLDRDTEHGTWTFSGLSGLRFAGIKPKNILDPLDLTNFHLPGAGSSPNQPTAFTKVLLLLLPHDPCRSGYVV